MPIPAIRVPSRSSSRMPPIFRHAWGASALPRCRRSFGHFRNTGYPAALSPSASRAPTARDAAPDANTPCSGSRSAAYRFPGAISSVFATVHARNSACARQRCPIPETRRTRSARARDRGLKWRLPPDTVGPARPPHFLPARGLLRTGAREERPERAETRPEGRRKTARRFPVRRNLSSPDAII